MADDHREQNRRSWNAVVPVHAAHRRGDAELLRSGGTTLFADERELLGDLRGKRVLHLLCNGGRDTLSLAAAGADVTGVDLSDAAITAARELQAACGLRAEFVCADALDYLRAAPAASFDVIYAAYGVVCWIDDLNALFQAISRVMKPAAVLAVIEFHPVSNMFNPDWQWCADYPAGGSRLQLDGVGDYVGAAGGALSAGATADAVPFVNPEPCLLFRWGLGEVLTAVARSGLVLEQVREYPYVNGERPFARMVADDAQRLFPPADVPSLPLMYGLRARKEGGRRKDEGGGGQGRRLKVEG